MQSSYRIIKNAHVNLKDTKTAIIETSIGRSEKFYKSNVKIPEEIPMEIPDEDRFIEEAKRQIAIEIEGQRQEILAQAREEAMNLKEQIKTEAHEEGYEEGYKKGYKDGNAQGLKQGNKEALNIKNRALELISQSEEYVEQYYKDNKTRLLELAATMAESIVHRTIDVSDDNVMMILEPLLKEYGHKENIIITCHPDNIDFLKGKSRELEEISGENKIIILKDGNLERNGCSLENSQQVMDLQIKTQIENILKDIQNME